MNKILAAVFWFLVVVFFVALVQVLMDWRDDQRRNKSRPIFRLGPPLFLFLLAALSASAQTNALPSIGDDLTTAAGWVSTVNTNYHYADLVVWDGPVYENQVNVANEIGASYDFWRSQTNALTTAPLLFSAVETRERQAGIAGSWLSESGGLEFGWQHCDFRAGAFGDGVYLNHPSAVGSKHRFGFEGGMFVDKMVSSAAAVGLFVSGQSGQKYPLFGANLNVSFGGGTGFLGLFKH
jgi:hypothetical protein